MKAIFMLVLLVAGYGAVAFGSGWRCNGDEGYRVKLINHTGPTRKPAVFIVSQRGSGTLLTAKNEEIRKTNLEKGVRYVADAGEHDPISGRAILYVEYKEGQDRPLKFGESVDGKLILDLDSGKEEVDLACYRYLKN